MATATVERKYALTRVRAGDYLLPSNDGKQLWRIRRYEDGPTHGLQVDWADRNFWAVWKFDGYFDGTLDPEFLDWDRWEQWDSSYDTRREAIDAALRMAA